MKDILITISGKHGAGKTTLLHAIGEFLEGWSQNVTAIDAEGSIKLHPCCATELESVRNIKLTTKVEE